MVLLFRPIDKKNMKDKINTKGHENWCVVRLLYFNFWNLYFCEYLWYFNSAQNILNDEFISYERKKITTAINPKSSLSKSRRKKKVIFFSSSHNLFLYTKLYSHKWITFRNKLKEYNAVRISDLRLRLKIIISKLSQVILLASFILIFIGSSFLNNFQILLLKCEIHVYELREVVWELKYCCSCIDAII